MEEEKNIPQTTEELADEAFDGVGMEGAEPRCVDVLPLSADFGLPMNLGDISTRASDEFEAIGEEVTRNIAALEFNPGQQSVAFDATSSEFEIGASFQANQSMFAPSPLKADVTMTDAPPLPFYITPAPTSFRTKNTLSSLRSELETAFAKCSVAFSQLDQGCGYTCSAFSMLSVIEIDVKIYNTAGELLVELRRMAGCRHAFGEVSDRLASTMNVCFVNKSPCLRAPAFDDSLLADLDIPMPSLTRSLDHESSMLSKDAPRDSFIQGARATGSLAKLDSLVQFSEGGEGITLAKRVAELTSSDDDEVRTVAMAAVANVATLKNVCSKWLDETIPTLVAGAQDDLPHVRREALRAIHFISTNDKALAAKLVRAGAVPTLELEANGGEDHQSSDHAMQAYASGALLACRG
jgi:hypothetical protein